MNLLGIVTPGPRLASLTGNRVLYRDGVPVATFAAGEITFLVALDPKEQWQAQNAPTVHECNHEALGTGHGVTSHLDIS